MAASDAPATQVSGPLLMAKQLQLTALACQTLSLTDEQELHPVLEGAVKQIETLRQDCPNRLSYINGGAGAMYIYIKLFELTGRDSYLQQATDIALLESDYYVKSDQVSEGLFEGRAGLLLATLYLYDKTHHPALLQLMDQLTRKILSRAQLVGRTLAWPAPFQLVAQAVCSFGYGSAGIGYVFALLADYFNHSFFAEVADKCFAYVNEQCFNEEKGLWEDYRRSISTAREFHRTMHAFKHAKSFSEEPIFNYGIAHGAAGIIFAQLNNPAILHRLTALTPAELTDHQELTDLAQLYLAAHVRYPEHGFFERAAALSRILESNVTTENTSTFAALQLALEQETPLSFYLPELHLEGHSVATQVVSFITKEEWQQAFAEVHCKRTLSLWQFFRPDEALPCFSQDQFSPLRALESTLSSVELGADQSEALQRSYTYERQLYDRRLKTQLQPALFISQFISRKERIAQLQIKNAALVEKKLVVSQQVAIQELLLPPEPADLNRELKRTYLLWLDDLEKGVDELEVAPIRFVLEGFQSPKKIKSALIETLNYCKSLNAQEIQPLLTFSNSRDKKHLLGRLPFIYMYQIKILIVDGVLEFYEATDD